MLILLLALVSQGPVTSTLPTDSAGTDIVYYGGKQVTFLAKQEKVILLDSAWVRYRGMTVYADSIHYDIKLHRLTARGDVLFSSSTGGRTENITGIELGYDIDTRKGMMRTARTAVENGFFFAGEVWLVRERVLNARGGSYTTCEYEHPHYAFYGPKVRLLMDDVAIARPVLFKLFGVPILAAPFWLVPIASQRKSGLLPFKVGSSSTEGFFAKNIAYYWVINDYSDLTLFADVMTKKGVQFRTEGIYIVRPYATGSVVAGFINEWDTKKRRYSVNAQHQSQRFLFGSEFAGQLDLVSDASYVSDYSEEKLDWLKPNSYSSGRLSRRLGRIGSLSISAARDVDFLRGFRYYELPSARLSFSAVPLGGGWNAGPSISAANRVETYSSDSLGRDTSEITRRSAGAGLSISSPQYQLGRVTSLAVADNIGLGFTQTSRNPGVRDSALSLSHNLSLSTQQTFLNTGILTQSVSLNQNDNLTDTLATTAGYSAALSAQVRLFRVFAAHGLGLHGLLHTVTPSASISYSPRVLPGGIFGRPQFGWIDSAQTSITAALRNTFQAKTDTAGTKLDLGYLDFTSGYDVIGRRPNPVRIGLGFRPLQRADLQLAVDANAGFVLDSLKPTQDYNIITSFNWNRLTTDSARRERGLALGLNHTLAPAANMLTASASLAGFGWKLSIGSLGYNFTTRQFANYDISLWRDLHCWEAIFTYRKLGARWDYDFLVRIKKLPDIRFGRSTFGSLLPSP